VIQLPATDVVIIGGGWSGLLMAKELTSRSSQRVIVLERGKPRNPKEYIEGMDELDYAFRYRMMQDVAKETITFRNSTKQASLPVRQFGGFLPGDGVGGAGEHWNGLTPRFLPDVFEMHKSTVERYGKSRLPEGSTIQDWGITYKEIEPFYLAAERLLGISGQDGERAAVCAISDARDQANVFRQAVQRSGSFSWLPPLPRAQCKPEPDLSQSGWGDSAGLPVLRVLRTLRLHGGRQGPAHQHIAACAFQTQQLYVESECAGAAHPHG
jgi:choline dehydrogenase-like flavoprotein